MSYPQELKYTSDHEWIKVDGDVATIGITNFAQGELGDIVYIEVDTVDEDVEREGVFGTIEAVKTVSDLFAPVSGTVLEVNEELDDSPEKVNEDPYGDGWIIKMKISDPSELNDLMDASAYEASL